MRVPLLYALRGLTTHRIRSAIIAASVGIGVAILAAADQISRALSLQLNRSAEIRAVTAFMGEQLNVSLSTMGLVASGAAAFIVFNTFRMAVATRRREIGRLRALGMKRNQILAVILLEAGVLGGVGALLGIPAGLGLSYLITRVMEATSPILNQFGWPPVNPLRLATSAVIGLTAATIGAYLPAREAVRSAAFTTPFGVGRRGPSRPARITRIAWSLAAGLIVAVVLFPPGRWSETPWSDHLTLLLLICWLALIAVALPGTIRDASRRLRAPAQRLLGLPSRLGIDNSMRPLQRATNTVLTLTVGVAMIVAVSGYLSFWFNELFFRTMNESTASQIGVGLVPVDLDGGLAAYEQVASMTISPETLARVHQSVGDRGVVAETYFVLEPKLSFLGDSYFSFVLDRDAIEASQGLYFAFDEDSWAASEPILGSGCALLITPAVAARNNLARGDQLELAGPAGPVSCEVAAVGPTFVGASVISLADASEIGLSAPVVSFVFPRDRSEAAPLRADLAAIADSTPGVWLMDLSQLEQQQRSAADSVEAAMQGMLLLAVVAAGLGVLNSLMVGFQERGDEFRVLRASGATSSQIGQMLITEAVTLGLYGGWAGLAAGLGATAIFSLSLGGTALGIPDFPIHEAAVNTLMAALRNGSFGLWLTPVSTGVISWIFVRRWHWSIERSHQV